MTLVLYVAHVALCLYLFASVFALAMTPVKASVVRRKTVGAFHKLRRAA